MPDDATTVGVGSEEKRDMRQFRIDNRTEVS